jgi:trans-2,3-dihydro-3-hydroxyanthranilate isomerase
MKIAVKKVDAFTETPLTGNPAGVVPNGEALTSEQMQVIAREMAVSETAFVLPASTPATDVRLRWFTPTVEVDLCDHATIAAFHVLAEEEEYGMKGLGTFVFGLETRSGVLPVSVEKSREGIQISLGIPLQEFTRAGQHKLDIMRILNLSLEEFENRMPIVMNRYLYVPVRRLHTLFALKPNLFAMAQFLTNRKLHGVCVFTTETVDLRSSFHSRFFAPSEGINEDPVTGSANGPLGVYLFERGEVQASGETVTLVGEQGDAMGRPGRVTVQLKVAAKRVVAVQIGGKAVTVLDGEMVLT